MIIMSFPIVAGYELLEKVGVGSFSTVYKATNKATNDVVAIKSLDKRVQRKSFADSVVKEISFLKLLKNDYIVKLIDFMWDSKHIYIITEYCDEGDLSNFIRKKYKLTEYLVKTFMQQLAVALKFLHRHNICHMDLKPQNLLLSSQPRLKLKLADFGLSTILSAETTEQCRYVGSLLYMAPEKLLNQSFDARVDLWSVGIIMYECLFGRVPYVNLTTKAIVDIMARKIPIELPKHTSLSICCENLLHNLLKYDPNERIGFEQFFEDEFIDLVHMPSAEHYLTAVTLIQEAVALDNKKQYAKSLPKYRKAIKYLEAFASAETNSTRQLLLKVKLNEYIRWADTLSEQLSGKNSGSCSGNATKPQPLSDPQFEILRELSVMTPKIATGLDIGITGELYFAEKKTVLALEKLTAALAILIPLLQNEPIGPRKDMLHTQVQKWLHLAENLKMLDPK